MKHGIGGDIGECRIWRCMEDWELLLYVRIGRCMPVWGSQDLWKIWVVMGAACVVGTPNAEGRVR